MWKAATLGDWMEHRVFEICSATPVVEVIIASVAGVGLISCCSTPPISPLALVAMDIAGVDEIYVVGRAQAIIVMALGTENIRPVQKIVGPSLSCMARIDERVTFCGGYPSLHPHMRCRASAPENTAGLPPSTWGDLTVTEDPTMPFGFSWRYHR